MRTRALAVVDADGRAASIDLSFIATSPQIMAFCFAISGDDARETLSTNANARLARWFSTRHCGRCRIYNAAREWRYPRSFRDAMKHADIALCPGYELERLLCPTIEVFLKDS